MKILIAGSSGMIGSAVTRHLIECGYEVFRLVRRTPGPGQVQWNPDAGEIDQAGLEGFDGVVHLATMPWPLRWSGKAKEMILTNRLATNGLLAKSLAGCAHKPRVLICASGMGYYAPSGETVLTEDSPAGTSFLAQLQQAGEASTAPASQAGHPGCTLAHPASSGRPRLATRELAGREWATMGELGRAGRTGCHHRVRPNNRDPDRTNQRCQSQPAAQRRVCHNRSPSLGAQTRDASARSPSAPADGRDGRGVHPGQPAHPTSQTTCRGLPISIPGS